MMTGSREDGGHEGLRQGVHDASVVLQEGFIPDRPGTIESFGTVVFVFAIVVLKTGTSCVGLKTHTAVRSSMKERRAITFLPNAISDRRDGVGGIGRDDIGLD